jgi:hypothetical protein
LILRAQGFALRFPGRVENFWKNKKEEIVVFTRKAAGLPRVYSIPPVADVLPGLPPFRRFRMATIKTVLSHGSGKAARIFLCLACMLLPGACARDYKIGDTGPAGGIVFYVRQEARADEWRYLEAAPEDAGEAAWGLPGKEAEDTGVDIGSGSRNTQLILEGLRQSKETGRAAQLCAAFESGGFKDWFLPGKNELDLMYQNLKARGLGGFKDAWYWSSSWYGSIGVWCQDFSSGGQGASAQDFPSYVRAIRAF